jgi:hypothetical protein
MKNIFKTASITAAGILMLVSCSDFSSMQVPETVSVKTDATYSANFGSFSLSDYISVDTIKKQIASVNPDGFTVYDYNPDSSASYQEFLVKYPVIDKTIDVGSSLSDIDLTSAGSSTSISQSFVIPDLDKTFTQNIAFSDLNDQITGKTSFTSGSLPVMDPGATVAVNSTYVPDLTLSISTPVFSTITYRAGKLDIVVTAPGGTTLTDLTLTAVLKNGATGTTISTSNSINVASGGTLVIPLAGKTLVPSMKISFSGSITGTSLGTSLSYTIAPAVSGADLSQVTGLTMGTSELGTSGTESINTSVDLSGTAPLTSAEIGTGTLSVQCALPSGWSGVTATASGFALSGALSSTSFTNNGGSDYLLNQALDLANLTFTPGTLTVQGTLSITLNNATIIFPPTGISLTTTAACTISKLKSATIDTSGYTLSESLSSAVPEELSSFVNTITYSKAGIKVGSYTNTLPAGNDITLSLDSTFLDIADAQGTVSSNTTNGTLELAKTGTGTINVSGSSNIDTTVTVSLPNTVGSTTKFVNLATNTTYTLTASDFTPELDWTNININTTSLSVSEPAGIDTGINFDSLMSSLPDDVKTAFDKDHVQIASLPIYLSVQMPALTALNALSLSGNIYLEYTSGSTEYLNILGTKTSSTTTPDTLTPKNILLTTQSDVVTTNLENADIKKVNLAPVFNARPASIKLFYAISPAGGSNSIDISYTDYEAIKNSGVNIAATVYIEIPLKLEFINDISLDVMAMAGKTPADDLLSRTEALNTSDYQKYLDAIKSITLGVTLSDSMGLAGANIKVTDTAGIFGATGETLEFSNNSTISLTGTQISSVLTTYPYMPAISLSIPSGAEFIIPRKASIGIKASIATDGTIQLYGGNN